MSRITPNTSTKETVMDLINNRHRIALELFVKGLDGDFAISSESSKWLKENGLSSKGKVKRELLDFFKRRVTFKDCILSIRKS